jgi:cephalosporin hydroxylase
MKTYKNHPLQHPQELEELVQFFQIENIKSYLEIGCKYGGSLWRIASGLPAETKIVAVNLPAGDQTPSLKECINELRKRGHDATLILGDSTHTSIVDQVKQHAPFDACLIDANHTLPYVRRDWENYGPMARIVCFHDIGFFRPDGHPQKNLPVYNIQVPIFWKEIKDQYRHQEIRHDKQDNGVGILWR